MKSTIYITSTDNIKNHAVVDNDKVRKETHDTLMDIFTFENKNGELRKSNLMDVSLYDDVIVDGNTKYVILSMLSK